MAAARWRFLPAAFQVPLMVFVGLLGGAMYVNTFALLVEEPRIKKEERELCINLATLWINLGIVLASVFELVMAQTILRP